MQTRFHPPPRGPLRSRDGSSLTPQRAHDDSRGRRGSRPALCCMLHGVLLATTMRFCMNTASHMSSSLSSDGWARLEHSSSSNQHHRRHRSPPAPPSPAGASAPAPRPAAATPNPPPGNPQSPSFSRLLALHSHRDLPWLLPVTFLPISLNQDARNPKTRGYFTCR